MKILYIGSAKMGSNAQLRAAAMRRIGCDVFSFDPYSIIGPGRWRSALGFKTGYRFVAAAVKTKLLVEIGECRFDVAWVDQGEAINADCVNALKRCCGYVLNYCTDDPTGPRDRGRWYTFLGALSSYDLLVVNRPETEVEFLELGAKRVIRKFRTYDPVAHKPLTLTEEEQRSWSSEVSFVGTWMPERGPFLDHLLRAGIPLSIRGDRWSRCSFKRVREAVVGPAVYGADYVKAIQCSKISLGLLSKGNRDAHTRRSVEIPYIGSLLCAERTKEHEDMYKDFEEAVFWSDADECAKVASQLLVNEGERLRIARGGGGEGSC